MGGIAGRTQRRKLRPVVDGLRDQLIGRGGRRGRQRLVGELIIGRLIRTHGAAQLRQCSLHGILRAEQKQLRLANIDVGETHIQLRSELVSGQLGHLIVQELARGDGLLRDLDYRLRVQNVEIGAIHMQQDRIAGGLRILRRGLGLKARAGHQIRRAAGIGDQLPDHHALRLAIEQTGSRQIAGPDSREIVALRPGDISASHSDSRPTG